MMSRPNNVFRDLFNLESYSYDLPDELIAQKPLKKRDQARLLVIDRRQQRISHDIFGHLNDYLPAKSCMVVNNSKVVPARLLGKRTTGGAVECFLLQSLNDGYSWEVLLKPLKKIREGETIYFESGLEAVLENKEKRIVRFNKNNLIHHLQKIGHIPLPPYIKRADTAQDKKDYQTVYAKQPGSVAAPTAGLHFTKPLIKSLEDRGHRLAEVTLHINYGTFKPVECSDIRHHPMHTEYYSADPALYKSLNKPVVAVGTTSCRVLESMALEGKKGSTDLFIYPGFKFRIVDALITNFHLPYSTLLMLVCAFGGYDLVMRAYQQAVKEQYRFYSYGDAMIII
jgi:S-adenosylmethionine:tRNA ribosyltransferase-isomerase